jgi:hypothetical protein
VSGGQIAALIFALLLLLPGGCFLIFGIGFATGNSRNSDVAYVMLPVAAAILALAGFLFWVALRRRPGGGAPPDAPPP